MIEFGKASSLGGKVFIVGRVGSDCQVACGWIENRDLQGYIERIQEGMCVGGEDSFNGPTVIVI